MAEFMYLNILVYLSVRLRTLLSGAHGKEEVFGVCLGITAHLVIGHVDLVHHGRYGEGLEEEVVQLLLCDGFLAEMAWCGIRVQ